MKNQAFDQDIKPLESGYADVNGLEMYYEVYDDPPELVPCHTPNCPEIER